MLFWDDNTEYKVCLIMRGFEIQYVNWQQKYPTNIKPSDIELTRA